MMFDRFTKEELLYSVNTYRTWSELLNSLGCRNTHNKMAPLLKRKLDEMGIDYSKLEYNIVIRVKNCRNKKLEDSEIFKKNSNVSSNSVRRRFREITSDSEYVCAICGGDHIWNGKELVLVMDHIDGDNSNHELSNLRWLCPNCNSQTETFCGKNKKYQRKRATNTFKTKTKTKKITYKNICPRCNKNYKETRANYCLECYEQLKSMYIDGTDILKPSREQLKSLIRTESFEEIGRQFGGVSSNAVKKWCKSLNLPYKKSDIKKISDKEWELI